MFLRLPLSLSLAIFLYWSICVSIYIYIYPLLSLYLFSISLYIFLSFFVVFVSCGPHSMGWLRFRVPINIFLTYTLNPNSTCKHPKTISEVGPHNLSSKVKPLTLTPVLDFKFVIYNWTLMFGSKVKPQRLILSLVSSPSYK